MVKLLFYKRLMLKFDFNSSKSQKFDNYFVIKDT